MKSSAPDLVRKQPETFSLTLAQRIARGWRLRCSFSGIVGIGNAPVSRKSQDVILEVAEALQQTPEFALGHAEKTRQGEDIIFITTTGPWLLPWARMMNEASTLRDNTKITALIGLSA